MAHYPGLDTRNGVYRIRRRIPTPVLELVKSKPRRWAAIIKSESPLAHYWSPAVARDGSIRCELVKTLGTRSRNQAIGLYHSVAAEWEAMFASISTTLGEVERRATDLDARQIATAIFSARDQQAASEFRDIGGDTESVRENVLDDLVHATSDHEQAEGEYIRDAMNLLSGRGFTVDASDGAVKSLAHYLRRVDIAIGKRDLQRLDKDYDPPIFDRLFLQGRAELSTAAEPSSSRTFAGAFNEYKDEKRRTTSSPKTVEGYEFVYRIFDEVIGANRELVSINRDDMKRVRDTLMVLPANSSKLAVLRGKSIPEAARAAAERGMRPLKPETANGHLSNLSAFFKWCKREGYIDRNPGEGLSVGKDPVPAKLRRLPFTSEQLVAIFHAPIYTGCKNDQAGYAMPGPLKPRRHRFWIPLIGLWTGMRLSEICQLQVRDIGDHGGVTCISVASECGEVGSDEEPFESRDFIRSRKTPAAVRLIPVHDELIRIGFLSYVERLREAGERSLFPHVKAGSDGYLSSRYSKWFAQFLEKVGAKTPQTCFHSFRHNYKAAMEVARIPRVVVLAIGGWGEKVFTSDNYGDGVSPRVAQAALAKLHFPGLSFSHLYENG